MKKLLLLFPLLALTAFSQITTVRPVTGTYDATSSLNTLKMYGYITLTHPHMSENAGAVLQTNDVTATSYGQALFSNSADQSANYVQYILTVPEDIDTTVDLRVERLKFVLSNTDAGTHRYVISMDDVADSAANGGTMANAVNCDFAGDASGASGDIETVSAVTLTGWKDALVAGRRWVIRLARDGNDAADASTVSSYSSTLVIRYGVTQ